MGVSEVVGRLCAGSDGFLGEQRCQVCSGEAYGWRLHLCSRDTSVELFREKRLAAGGWLIAFYFRVGDTNLARLHSFAWASLEFLWSFATLFLPSRGVLPSC